MSRYRRIETRLWSREDFRALSAPAPSAQWLWLYLLSGPHTIQVPGLFSAGEAGLAEALGWPVVAFRKAFRELTAQDLATADWAARVVWIPEVITYNDPESPSVVKGWRAALAEIPGCDLKRQALDALGAYLGRKGAPWAAAWQAACGAASSASGPQPDGQPAAQPGPHQEQEQETTFSEQEQDVPSSSQAPRQTAHQHGQRPPRPRGQKHVAEKWQVAS